MTAQFKKKTQLAGPARSAGFPLVIIIIRSYIAHFTLCPNALYIITPGHGPNNIPVIFLSSLGSIQPMCNLYIDATGLIKHINHLYPRRYPFTHSVLPKDTHAVTGQAGIRTQILITQSSELECNALDHRFFCEFFPQFDLWLL